jgi:hypothetical protein
VSEEGGYCSRLGDHKNYKLLDDENIKAFKNELKGSVEKHKSIIKKLLNW